MCEYLCETLIKFLIRWLNYITKITSKSIFQFQQKFSSVSCWLAPKLNEYAWWKWKPQWEKWRLTQTREQERQNVFTETNELQSERSKKNTKSIRRASWASPSAKYVIWSIVIICRFGFFHIYFATTTFPHTSKETSKSVCTSVGRRLYWVSG